ncbi:MAG: hypothetical protein ABJG78_15325 [Cyclobacteriaceae bacterium]
MAKRTLADKLESFRLLIFNSGDVQVAPILEAMGIDADYLSNGVSLYNETVELVDQQKKEYQDQSLAYDNFYLEKDEADLNLNRTLKLVRVLTRRDEDLQDRLKLGTLKPNAIEEWIEKTVDFYNRLLNEAGLLANLARFNVTVDQLEDEKDQISDLRTLRNNAISEKGQAQEATRLRNEMLDELTDYCMELKAVAEIALESQPQLLEKLGVLVRS